MLVQILGQFKQYQIQDHKASCLSQCIHINSVEVSLVLIQTFSPVSFISVPFSQHLWMEFLAWFLWAGEILLPVQEQMWQTLQALQDINVLMYSCSGRNWF